jgi:sugar lactone lactonase YvrE
MSTTRSDVRVTRLDVPHCALGEGPVWDVQEAALYFVDAAGGHLHRHDPATGATRTWDFDGRVACLALREGGGAIVALVDGLHLFDFGTGELTLVGDPHAGDERTILNDGKVDPRGRFLCGSVDSQITEGRGALHSVAPDGTITTLETGIKVSNGPCWSPDGRTFYHADSVPQQIFAYDYDLASGAISGKRVFAETHALGGIPDGATVDAEGFLWSAICEGSVVARFAPDGTLDRTVQLPTSMVSSVMFGGPELDLLYVTSIDPPTFGRPAEEQGGATYVVEGLGVRGLPEPRFAG